jgi:hypothetical protein
MSTGQPSDGNTRAAVSQWMMRHLIEIHLAGAAIIALLLGIVGFAIGAHFGDPVSGLMLGAAAAFVGGLVGWYAAQFGMALVEVALFILFPRRRIYPIIAVAAGVFAGYVFGRIPAVNVGGALAAMVVCGLTTLIVLEVLDPLWRFVHYLLGLWTADSRHRRNDGEAQSKVAGVPFVNDPE